MTAEGGVVCWDICERRVVAVADFAATDKECEEGEEEEKDRDVSLLGGVLFMLKCRCLQ